MLVSTGSDLNEQPLGALLSWFDSALGSLIHNLAP
jgi:hypothetical protein